MNSTVRELVDRLEGFTISNCEIVEVRRNDVGKYFVKVEVLTDMKGMEVYEFCRCLNGWDKTDYFSVLEVEKIGSCITATVERIKEEQKEDDRLE